MFGQRGRPKASSLPYLIRQGELQDGPCKCDFCFRIFPRQKSLMAHRRIHLDLKPYNCTYPGCCRRFTQSGQLKTHVRRHTGEKPFACPVIGCSQRYIHSTRRCTKHPEYDLERDGLEEIYLPENPTEDELRWFEEYKENQGKPAKRKMQSNLQSKRKPNSVRKRHKNNSSSSSGISSDNSSVESSPASSSINYYSEASTDSNCSLPIRIPNNSQLSDRIPNNSQLSDIQRNQSVDRDTFEVAHILCSIAELIV